MQLSSILSPVFKNLDQINILLDSISDEELTNITIGPYYTSIGSHIRHILDIFQCAIDGIPQGKVDLTARSRNIEVETKGHIAAAYLDSIKTALNSISERNVDEKLIVIDDLGLGILEVDYTLGGLLCQAHSHAIHHFASMGYMLKQLDIKVPSKDFGYNPTTVDRLDAMPS